MSDKHHDTRGSGQRRPGPHQRRQEAEEKAAVAKAPKEVESPRAQKLASRPGRRPSLGRAVGAVQSGQSAHSGHAAKSALAVQPTAGDDGDAIVAVRAHGAERLRQGHHWIYRSDAEIHAALPGGSAVRLVDERGRTLGRAFYSQKSQIALRLLTREEEPIDDAFLLGRLRRAIALRDDLQPDEKRTHAVRLVHGDADGLPGLIVDRYADCLSIQTLTEAADQHKDWFVERLVELLAPRAVVERNDVKVRAHEGLAERKGLLHGSLEGPVEWLEGEVSLRADLLAGQKTGAFLDQAENHVVAGRYAFGRALDAFAYTGGFALQLLARATSVQAVDQSAAALEQARASADRFGPLFGRKLSVLVGNAFDYLKDQVDEGARWDTIVLDPPGFAKTRVALEPALRGYKEINLRAFQMLSPGGILVTCSCSYPVDSELFEKTVLSAASDARRTVQVVERRGAGRDHPTLLGVPETRYLKCLILRVL
jgi:23S rRNA (cytosine1962-C5)-methyltransferase